MNDRISADFKAALATKLADSLTDPLPDSTPRRVFGAVRLAGKATAVVAADGTTYVYSSRRVILRLMLVDHFE